MKNITIEQYLEAIKTLSTKQIEILRLLCDSPKTAKELAKELNYKGFQAANNKVGKIGKDIATFLGVSPETYYNGHNESPAYFTIVGPYKESGWEMNENLREALEKVNDNRNENTTNKYWIQYHNCEMRGCYPSGLPLENTIIEEINIPSTESERSGIYTKKRKAAYDSVGNNIFLVFGIGKPKKYYLWSKILVDEVISAKNNIYNVYGKSIYPQNPISLDELDNFNDFKLFCGNFGIGLQNISKHPFSSQLDSFFNENSQTEILDDFIDSSVDSYNLMHEINEKMKNIHPTRVNKVIESTLRNDTKIVRLLKEINNYTCQYPNCDVKIPKKNGGYYIEVAHIKPVAKGGQSIIGNLIVLCPNHHKAFDYGDLKIIEQKENEISGYLNGEKFEIRQKEKSCR